MNPSVKSSHLSDPALLERMSETEVTEFFDRDDNGVRVKTVDKGRHLLGGWRCWRSRHCGQTRNLRYCSVQ